MTEIAFTETGRWFVANRGRAMALIAPGQQLGSALLPTIVVLITRLSGDWRTVWFASASAVVLVGLPVIVGLMRVERVAKSHAAHGPGSTHGARLDPRRGHPRPDYSTSFSPVH